MGHESSFAAVQTVYGCTKRDADVILMLIYSNINITCWLKCRQEMPLDRWNKLLAKVEGFDIRRV